PRRDPVRLQRGAHRRVAGHDRIPAHLPVTHAAARSRTAADRPASGSAAALPCAADGPGCLADAEKAPVAAAVTQAATVTATAAEPSTVSRRTVPCRVTGRWPASPARSRW